MTGQKPSFFYRFILGVARLFFRIFYDVKVFGIENFHKGSALIAANHVSYLDPPLLAISCPEEVHFIAKGSLFRPAFFRRMIEALNTHPVKGSVKDVHTFKKIHDLLDEGKKVVLFPEGTRAKVDQIGTLKRGIASIFMKSHCSVIPVYLHGTYAAWNRSHKFPRFGKKLICRFGTPIHWDEFAHLDPIEIEEAFLLRLSQILKDLKEESEG